VCASGTMRACRAFACVAISARRAFARVAMDACRTFACAAMGARRVFACAALLACCGAAAAQDAAPPPGLVELCKTTLCRTPKVRVNMGDGAVFEGTQPYALPVLLNGGVSVYLGEQVYIEAQVEKGELTLLRAVPAVADPARTLVFKFQQKPGAVDSLLEVTNPFKSDLKFSLGMMLPDGSSLRATSSCPVRAGLKLFEHWPYPIYQLVVVKARALKEGESRDCVP